MRIMLTVNAAWNIWNFRRPVVEALLADGHQLTVLAPLDDSVDQLESLGCRILPLKMDVKGKNLWYDFQLLIRFYRCFRTEKPEVVLGYTVKNNVFGALAARACGIPFIPNVSGLGTAFLSTGILRQIVVTLYRLAFKNLKVVFFQNTDDEALFVELAVVKTEQSRCLPASGIDLEYFIPQPLPEPSVPFTFLLIARMLRDKGVNEFVAAARELKAEHPGIRCQLLGPVDVENPSAISASQVNAWVEEGVVEYLGVHADVRPAIAAAHCVVLPSYREGAPRTLLEAAAMARPTITTDVPGCRSVVEHGKTGLVCEVQNVQSLHRAMLALMQLPPKEQAAMGQAGRVKMEQEYNQARVVAAYRQAVVEVVYA